MGTINLTEMEHDALRECANVGIGNAATALSKLLHKKIGIQIPETKIMPLKDFSSYIGGAETVVSGIYLHVHGDLKGEVLFLFSCHEAIELTNLLLGTMGMKPEKEGDLDESGFMEMANIVVGSYLNALADMLDLKILPSVPHAATDMAQALVDHVLIELGKHSDSMLTVKTMIQVDEHNIGGSFLIIFDTDSLVAILKRLKEKYGV